MAHNFKASGEQPPAVPLPMDLFCPGCGLRHVDQGEWETTPHKTHRCVDVRNSFGGVKGCGREWRRPTPRSSARLQGSDFRARCPSQHRDRPGVPGHPTLHRVQGQSLPSPPASPWRASALAAGCVGRARWRPPDHLRRVRRRWVRPSPGGSSSRQPVTAKA